MSDMPKDSTNEHIEQIREHYQRVRVFLCAAREAHRMRLSLFNFQMEALERKRIDYAAKKLVDSVYD